MQKNRFPGFTADESLGGSSWPATTALYTAPANSTVYPQRIAGPYGPIGLPGQNGCEVCWHMCMTFGGGAGMQHCHEVCSLACAADVLFSLRL